MALSIWVHSLGSIVGNLCSFYPELNFEAAAKINLNRFSNTEDKGQKVLIFLHVNVRAVVIERLVR